MDQLDFCAVRICSRCAVALIKWKIRIIYFDYTSNHNVVLRFWYVSFEKAPDFLSFTFD